MTVVAPQRPMYGGRVWSPKEGYNLVAAVYDEWYWRPFWLHNEKPYIERIARQAENVSLSLDLGCGTGAYCSVLESISNTVGVDPSFEMLDVARRHVSTNTRLLCGSARALPLVSEMVEVTVAARSLCHEADLVGAFREIARVTRKGGVCIVSEVHAQHDYPRTRIPLGSADVHIETFKRTPQEFIDIAAGNGDWELEHQCEVLWQDLSWQPEDARFFRVDRASHRPIFFVLGFRRR